MTNRSPIYFWAITLFSVFGFLFLTTCTSKDVIPKSPAPSPIIINTNSSSSTGTKGILSFNLEWSSSYNQMDLYVQGPYGSLISKNNTSASGGNMDLICDCCSYSSTAYYNGYFYENIFYSTTPNSGSYSYYVRNNGSCGSSSYNYVSYTLRVYANGYLSQTKTGSVYNNQSSSTYSYVY